MMKCDKIIERYLKLDNTAYIPASIRLHILVCSRCHKEISMLNELFNSFQNTSPFDMEKDMGDEVMNKISNMQIEPVQNISNFKWIAVGSVILASIFLVPFNDSLTWLRVYFRGNLEIPLSIVLGLAISIYTTLFIASHLDELKKIIRLPWKKTQ